MTAFLLILAAVWIPASIVAAIGIGRAISLGHMTWSVALGLRAADDLALWDAEVSS